MEPYQSLYHELFRAPTEDDEFCGLVEKISRGGLRLFVLLFLVFS